MRGGQLGAAAVAGGVALGWAATARVGGRDRRTDMVARGRAALRRRSHRVPAGLSLARLDRRRAGHSRAARRPGAGGAARRLLAVRDARGRGLGAATRVWWEGGGTGGPARSG